MFPLKSEYDRINADIFNPLLTDDDVGIVPTGAREARAPRPDTLVPQTTDAPAREDGGAPPGDDGEGGRELPEGEQVGIAEESGNLTSQLHLLLLCHSGRVTRAPFGTATNGASPRRS